MKQVMVDLETMGKGPKAPIIAIGAVRFDPETDFIENDMFAVGVTLHSAIAYGAEMDASTVLWWMRKDNDAARHAWLEMPSVDLPSALEGLSMWMAGDLPVWGNGATFDNVIVRAAYDRSGMECPWNFRNDRCFRTLRALRPDIKVPQVGTSHTALDDARWQARYAWEALRGLIVPVAAT